jgi:hypothetical protein
MKHENLVAYELYVYDEVKGYELIGILPERRKDAKRITKESILKWGRIVLGDDVDKNSIIFKQITMNNTTGQISEVNMPFGN